jgi:hypothetical protein
MHTQAPSTPEDLRRALGGLGLQTRGELALPERTLERLLDLPRAVEIARVLDRQSRQARAGAAVELDDPELEAALSRMRLLESDLLMRLGALRERVARRFAGAYSGLRAAPDAVAAHALLHERGALGPTATGPRERAARHLAGRYASVVLGALTIVLKEVALLRQDLHQGLAGCGQRARELCELDRLLDGMFRYELSQGAGRLATQLGDGLASSLREQIAELSSDCTVDQLEPWFAADGSVGAFMRQAEHLAHTLLELEWSSAFGLLQGARSALQAARDASNDEGVS